ncbi:MAG TPA: VOC family protein [Gemmatimonadaceae bacterium]|jgi:hypothetical protein
MADTDGRFVWYELLTSDTSGAKKFYPAVTGWGTQPFGSDGSYEMWTNKGSPMGGMMNISEEQKKRGIPPHWLPYIGVSNVDDTTARAGKLGAKTLVPPTDIPDVGRFSVIADPQGAVFGIVSSNNPMKADFSPEVGEFSWHELTTDDHVAAFDFYSKLFGWTKTSEFDMGAMGIYQMYGKNNETYGGMFNKTPEMKMPPVWVCYVRVNDVNAAADAIKKGGGQVINGPMEVPGGDWIAQATDPQGAFFAVHQKKA